MDPQNNPVVQMPAPIVPSNNTNKNKDGKGLVVLAIVIGLVMLGGLAYANVMLMQSSKKINELNDKTIKLEEITKKGATDELLGFDKVDKDNLQSVLLTSGQVYFGKITSMTTENIVIEDIYYLRNNDKVQPAGTTSQDISLVKLGCELHKPEDKMTIIRSNVDFWENLESDGQVSKAVATYKQQNPDGQKCTQ